MFGKISAKALGFPDISRQTSKPSFIPSCFIASASFSVRTSSANADALRVRTKMTTAGETIPAMSAGDVAFPDDEVAFGKSAHICSHRCDLTDKFVADCHRHGNGLLRPIIPIINVNISAAD